MKDNKNSVQHVAPVSPEVRTELLAEYSALRNEILKRIEIRNYLLTFSLIVAGTILAFGSKDDVTVFVLLLYPILAFFIALAWMQADMQIGYIGFYIKKHIEPKLDGVKWETFYSRKRREVRKGFFARPLETSAAGVFITTEILAVLLSIKKLTFSTLTFENILLLFDILCIIWTIRIIKRRSIKGKW